MGASRRIAVGFIRISGVALALSIGIASCGPSSHVGPDRPPLVCRPGTTWAPGGAPAFRDATVEWGDLAGLEGHGLEVGDLDGDGWVDLVAFDLTTNARGATHVLFNRPAAGEGRTFVDETAASGFLATRDGEGGRVVNAAALGDLDDDGDLDAVTGIWRDYDQMGYRGDVAEVVLNDGSGHFSLGPAIPMTTPDDRLTSSIALADVDLDGSLDAFFAYWWVQPPFSTIFGQHPEIWHGDGAGGFGEITDAMGVRLLYSSSAAAEGTHARPLFGGTACDVNGDMRPDLLGAAYAQTWSLLWVSDGDALVEVGRPAGVAGDSIGDGTWMQNGNTFSFVCGDVDGDGDLDLYSSTIRHADARGSYTDPSSLLVNATGAVAAADVRFDRPDRDALGLRPPPGPAYEEGGQNNGMLDFDDDGRLDVYLGASAYDDQEQASWLFQQLADGTFRYIGAAAGFDHSCPHGMGIGDFDHDGDEDVVVGTYACRNEWPADVSQPFRFYENVSGENNSIAIHLIGSGAGGANRGAIGAYVRITTDDGRTQTREIHGTWGRTGLSREQVAHFGLGSSCAIERIEVRWPDAARTVQVFEDVVPNYRVEITQGSSDVVYLDADGNRV
jgi:hypothetical protein